MEEDAKLPLKLQNEKKVTQRVSGVITSQILRAASKSSEEFMNYATAWIHQNRYEDEDEL